MLRAKLTSLLTTLFVCVPLGLAQLPAADPRNIDASAFGMLVNRQRAVQILLLFLVLCGLLAATLNATAQSPHAAAEPIVITNLGAPLADLGGRWQFHSGDNVQWASPAYDDSSWNTLTTDKGWDLQGYPDTGGFGWYRRHIRFAGPSAAGLPLAMPPLIAVISAYEVYWNNVRIGGCGSLPPHLSLTTCWQTIDLPSVPKAGEAVVAIRIFSRGRFHLSPLGVEGLIGVPQIGSRAAVEASTAQQLYLWWRSGRVTDVLGVLYVVAALITWMVWLLNRGERLYLWLALFLSIKAFRVCLSLWEDFGALPFVWEQLLLFTVGYGCQFVSLWMVLMRLFRLDDSTLWRRLTVWMIALCLALYFANGLPEFWVADWTQGTGLLFRVCWFLSTSITLYSLVLIAAGMRRKLDPARWCVAVTATISILLPVIFNVFQLLQRWDIAYRLHHPLFSLWGGGVSAWTLADLLLLLALCSAATLSLLEARHERTETELEMRSAAEVQHVLLPERTPSIPGLIIESVYKPAGQVGGDFFQIIPVSNGGAIVVIGDVSGKGMGAAMTVSLLVGTLHTLADYTESPAEILATMNQRVLGRSNGGFTTCLVLLVQPDGSITLANAGHIAPYIAGKELAVETGLPLGLVEGASYFESKVELAPGKQLTLVTDGVIEARNSEGQLFGFDRTAQVSCNTAELIALEGCAFGQEDDITVLTVALTPVAAAVG